MIGQGAEDEKALGWEISVLFRRYYLELFLCVGLVHMITGGESRDEKTELAESSQEKKSGEQPGEKEKENQKEKGNRWEGGQDW